MLEHLNERDTLQPLGFEEDSTAPTSTGRPTDSVVVVGAGPAGLAAASTLQVRMTLGVLLEAGRAS